MHLESSELQILEESQLLDQEHQTLENSSSGFPYFEEPSSASSYSNWQIPAHLYDTGNTPDYIYSPESLPYAVPPIQEGTSSYPPVYEQHPQSHSPAYPPNHFHSTSSPIYFDPQSESQSNIVSGYTREFIQPEIIGESLNRPSQKPANPDYYEPFVESYFSVPPTQMTEIDSLDQGTSHLKSIYRFGKESAEFPNMPSMTESIGKQTIEDSILNPYDAKQSSFVEIGSPSVKSEYFNHQITQITDYTPNVPTKDHSSLHAESVENGWLKPTVSSQLTSTESVLTPTTTELAQAVPPTPTAPTPPPAPITTPPSATPATSTPTTPAPTSVSPAVPTTAPAVAPTTPIARPPGNASVPIEAPSLRSDSQALEEISINFNNVSMIEYIRFISRISGKNFVFDEQDLQFTVTIVSEEPTSIGNLMAALLQELKIRDLALIEQGNNIIIHRNSRIRAPGQVVADGIAVERMGESEIVTRVFRLNTLDPIKASEIIRPLLSDDALVEVLRDSNNLILTDLLTNVNKIAQLIGSLDAPNSGMRIGQYVARNAFVDSLSLLAERILQPIAQGNPFVLVPHPSSNSIFIVSNPFLVDKALGILEHLDINEGRTKVLDLERLRYSEGGLPGEFGPGGSGGPGGPGGLSGPGGTGAPGIPTEGFPGGAASAGIGTEGRPTPRISEEAPFIPGGVSSGPRWTQDLPTGHIERTLFFIHKLKYRRGDQIEIALRKIADSLIGTGTTNADLITAINSIQWIESSNSLIVTGTASALEKIRELIEEIDVPLRQVFIEMLILDTTITDSLDYTVEWDARFGGGNTAGAEAFIASPASTINIAAAQTGLINGVIGPVPNASTLLGTQGFSWGIIGRNLSHGGQLFNSIATLVRAVHIEGRSNIVMNPKIITEDNNPAEIFVGSTARYKTQSISNDQGDVITNNFQFIDVGTTLRVTPLIGNNDVITLEIIQEITSVDPAANLTSADQNIVDVNLVTVLNKNRTTTKVHVPNGFFVILSGMIQDTRARSKSQIPCLGGIPILGVFGKQKLNREDKRNLMIFIRPLIIDTDEEIEDLTKRQQDIYREKTKFRRSWNFEIDEALDFLNIKPTEPDEIGCTIK